MLIKYGLNGSGKSKYKNDLQNNPNYIVLNSVTDDWTTDRYSANIIMSQFARVENENENNIKKIIDKIKSANEKINIGYSGTNADFKAFFDGLNLDEELLSTARFSLISSISTPHTAIVISKAILNETTISSLLGYVTTMSPSNRDDILGATKFFASIKTAVKQGTENYINELNVLKNRAEIFVNTLIPDMRTLVLDGNVQMIDLLFSSTSTTALKAIIKSQILENIKFHFGSELEECLILKDKFANKINLSISHDLEHILRTNFNLNSIAGNATAVLNLSFGQQLSSGQLTVIEAMILSENLGTKILILDDAMETLDEQNRVLLLDKIIDNPNVEILTHDMNTVEIIQNYAKVEGKTIALSKINIPSSILLTWSGLLSSYRALPTNPSVDEIVIRSIIKLLSRYHAKNGSIHSVKGNANKATIISQSNYEHFLFAGQIFHYNGKIAKSLVNEFFEWIPAGSGFTNSIEIIDILINKLDTISPIINGIDTQKMKVFFEKIKIELQIEKNLYDEAEINGTNDFWTVPEIAFRKYGNARRAQSIQPRDNSSIHLLDTNPHVVFGCD